MKLKQNPDSYLLYESGRFITFNIRLKVIMKQKIDVDALKKAAQTAFKRFPYYAKEMRIAENGEIALVDNPRPLVVSPTKPGHVRFGTPDVNYHLCSIDYEDSVVYFNIYHGLCGGCGVMFWIKSTMWHYVKEAFGVTLETGNIKTADTPLTEGETAFPDPDALPDAEPVGSIKKDMVYIPAAEYVEQLVKMPFRDIKFYELELDAKDFIKYARSNDGSPNSILAALMFRACCKVAPRGLAKAFRGNILCNYRADVGCPETYHDLVRLMPVFYPRTLENKSIEFLSTMTRSVMYMMMQPEFSVRACRENIKSKEDIDARSGLRRKRFFAFLHSPYKKPPFGTFLISYVGKDEWYGLEDYIERIHCITDGDLMIEVNALRDKLFLTFMELGGHHKYYDAFCEAMREENIHFIEHGEHYRQLPYSVIPKRKIR